MQAIYCPPLDPSLVAAIANDEGQTLQSAHEVLKALAGDAAVSQEPEIGTSEGASEDGGSDDARIERMLDEFHLGEEFDQQDVAKQPRSSKAKWSRLSRPDSPVTSSQSSSAAGETDADGRSSMDDLSDREFPPYDEVREKVKEKIQPSNEQRAEQESGDPILFLIHAFPTRTRPFLAETLDDCRGDVGVAIDTLMTIDLVEREEADAAAAALLRQSSLDSSSTSSSPSSSTRGLDYEALADGSRSSVKGKKGRAMRKKAHEEQLRAMGHQVRVGKAAPTKVTLGDIRQGGGSASTSAGPSTPNSRPRTVDYSGLSDREIAERLAKEEDPTAGEPVKDNQWLLTSSVLSQISTLLDIPPQQAASTYNSSGFNLHIAVGRLIDTAASPYPTLQSLEEAGSAPEGTAQSIVESLASLSGKSTASTSLCLRATQGRQDATLDLLNLVDVVREAAAGEKPDELDPLGKLRHPDAAALDEARRRDGAIAAQRGVSTSTPDPRPGEAVDFDSLERARRAGGFSRAAAAGQGRAAPTGQAKAMASLRDGTAMGTVSFPPSSAAAAGGLSEATQSLLAGTGDNNGGVRPASRLPTTGERERAIAHAQAMAADYRTRRDRCLQQAGHAWRATPGGKDRGAAFYYADEARRLEAKGRAWQLRAAEELVAHRRRTRADTGSDRGAGTVDLHGVTVREALSIVSEELNKWWSLPSGGGNRREALTIVTGAGRHSPNQVAILTPSVAKYLQREGWRADVDRQRGVIVVRGRM